MTTRWKMNKKKHVLKLLVLLRRAFRLYRKWHNSRNKYNTYTRTSTLMCVPKRKHCAHHRTNQPNIMSDHLCYERAHFILQMYLQMYIFVQGQFIGSFIHFFFLSLTSRHKICWYARLMLFTFCGFSVNDYDAPYAPSFYETFSQPTIDPVKCVRQT